MFDANPFPYLEVRRPFILGSQVNEWQATISHHFVNLLHAKGKLLRLFTQNIDGLDYQTDVPADKIVPVHGTIRRIACENCGAASDFDAFCESVRSNIKDIYSIDSTAPGESSFIRCGKCNSPGLKPTTVLFGSSLPQRFFTSAASDLPQADLLIVAGTSLIVSPANGIASEVPTNVPRLVVNREPVGADLPGNPIRYGAQATRDVFAPGDCDDTFLQLTCLLGWEEDILALADRLPEQSRAILAKQLGNAAGAAKGVMRDG